MTAELEFGYRRGLPDTAHTAWGARAIVYQDSIDIPPDRQCADGPRKDRLLTALNDRFPRSVLNKQAVRVQGNSDEELILFENDEIIVKGSAQRSFGYLYIVAYFKDEEPVRCACARHSDGSVTTSLCPLHADQDPCLTMARVTGKRRRGSVVRGVCSACKWSASSSREES